MSVRRNMIWMAASQASAFIAQFVTTVVLARLLTPYEMGIFAAALAVAGLLAILRNVGLGNYVIRAGVLTPEMLATSFTINALLSLLIAAAVAVMAVLGGALLGESGVRTVLLVVAAVPLINIFEFRPAMVTEREGRFGDIAAVNVIRAVASGVVAVVLAYHDHSYMSLAYGQVVGGVLAAVGFNLVGWRHASLRVSLAGWRGILSLGAHMFVSSGIGVGTVRLAELALARLLGLEALGMYSRAGSVANMAWESISLIVGRPVFVDMAEQRRQGRSLRNSYLRVTAMMTGLLWPAFVGLAVLAGPLVLLLYGPQWGDAGLPLSLLALSSVPSAALVMASAVLVVTERTATQAQVEVIRSLAGLALFLGGCLLGLNWAAASRILEGLLAFALYRRLLQRMTDTKASDFTPIYLRSLALTVVAVAPAAGVMVWYEWSAQAPLAVLGVAVVTGTLLWGGLLYQMRHPLFEEARWMLSRLRAKPAARPIL